MAEVIVIHGYAGSGKTTQCKRVASEVLGEKEFQHISIDDRLQAIKSNTTASQFADFINYPLTLPSISNKIIESLIFDAIEGPSGHDLVLIDSYPRFVHTVNDFHTALQDSGHELIGTIHFDISLTTSIERILSNSPSQPEETSDEILESFITFNYSRDSHITRMAILALSRIAPVEIIDASGDKDKVHNLFVSALGRLSLQNHNDSST